MEQNKVRTYLLYATGEIFLVVIGILIALQINNWNEARKERDYEIKMLSEVQKSLQADIKDKTYVIELFERAEISTNELLKMRNDPNYPRDSLNMHLDRIQVLGLFFPYSDGAFEAIKSSGLDKISNDELRVELIHLYSYSFRSISIFINELTRPTMIQKFQLFEEVFPSELQPGDDGKPQSTYSYDNFEEVLQRDEFDELLKLSQDITSSITPRLLGLVQSMTKMANMIHEEIEN